MRFGCSRLFGPAQCDRKRMLERSAFALTLLSGLAVAVPAAFAVECVGIKNDAARLLCYDSQFLREPSLFAGRCEATLLWQLRDKTGYHRARIEESSSPVQIEEYIEGEIAGIRDRDLQPPSRAADEIKAVRNYEATLKADNLTPYRYVAVITFDMANALNASMRIRARCTQVSVPSFLQPDDGPAITVEFLQ